MNVQKPTAALSARRLARCFRVCVRVGVSAGVITHPSPGSGLVAGWGQASQPLSGPCGPPSRPCGLSRVTEARGCPPSHVSPT